MVVNLQTIFLKHYTIPNITCACRHVCPECVIMVMYVHCSCMSMSHLGGQGEFRSHGMKEPLNLQIATTPIVLMQGQAPKWPLPFAGIIIRFAGAGNGMVTPQAWDWQRKINLLSFHGFWEIIKQSQTVWQRLLQNGTRQQLHCSIN